MWSMGEYAERKAVAQQNKPAPVGTEMVPKGRSQDTSRVPYGFSPADYAAARDALQVAADIVENDSKRMVAAAPDRYTISLLLLYDAAIGRHGDQTLDGAQRLASLEVAIAGLQPAIDQFRKLDATWLDEHLFPRLEHLRRIATYEVARDRINNSVRVGNGVLEIPSDDADAHRQGTVLHLELPKLRSSLSTLNEQVIRLKHDGIHHEAEALLQGKHEPHLGPGTLVYLQNTLLLVDGWLTLSDDEFRGRLGEVRGWRSDISTYAELVKAVVELAGGAVTATAAYAAVIAKLTGNEMLFASAAGVARSVGLHFANTVALIEVVHGVVVLFDPDATRQEKIDAAVSASSGATWLVARHFDKVAFGAAASTAIIAGYAELKLVAHLYWEAKLGLTTGMMRLAFETIQRHGANIARKADALARAGLLAAEEHDPESASSLRRVQDNIARDLGDDIDYLLDDCQPRGIEADVAKYPGSYPLLREVFAPLASFKGLREVAPVSSAAPKVLERIAWSLAHAGDIVLASTKDEKLNDLEEEIAKRKEGARAE